jgi:hypothetical protein
VARLDELLGGSGSLVKLHTAAANPADVLTPDDQERVALIFDNPSRIDGAAVRALADVLAAQRRLDDTIGPEALITATAAQVDVVKELFRHANGPHRGALAEVVAEYVQFAGWLYAESRRDADAVRTLTEAEELADVAESAVLAAQAANFRGYVARQQRNPRGIVRWFLTEHHTPGANVHQRIGAAAQAAHGYAAIGDADQGRRLLDVATSLIDRANGVDAPRTAYWLNESFHRLNLGLAHLALDDFAVAADHLASGLSSVPDEWQDAAWTKEYRRALGDAVDHK